MKRVLQISDREWAQRHTPRARNKRRLHFEGTGHIKLTDVQRLKTLYGKPVLPAPKRFDLSDHGLTDELADFLTVFEYLLSQYSRVYLSFESTVSIRLPMFLILVALQEKYNAKVSVMWSKKSPTVNKMIRDSGEFRPAVIRRNNMLNPNYPRIPVISGSNQEFSDLSEELVDAIRDKFYNGDMPDNIESKVSQAIIETLENVGRHAYPTERDQSMKKWWLICSIGHVSQSEEDYMYLAIYDRGRGIPLSFDDSKVFRHRVKKYYPNEYDALFTGGGTTTSKTAAIKKLAKNMISYVQPLRESIGDAGLIYASMMHDMTRIDDDSHGQGSVSIKDVITDDENSNLIIFSNKGCYQYSRGSDDEHIKLDQKMSYPERCYNGV
ncbi:hypothetical protein [Vibrio cholerae]